MASENIKRVKSSEIELKDRLVEVRRVTKVTKGGRAFGFSAVVVVGNEGGVVGHGLGKEMHEKPEMPNYGKRGSGKKFQEGMVVAIEPMINLGSSKINQLNDGWTILTRDKKPSAHFEHNIAIIDGKPKLLSTFDYVYQALGIKSDEEVPFK